MSARRPGLAPQAMPLLKWLAGALLLWLLATAPGSAWAAGGCSPYMGQVVINEVRVGAKNSIDLRNQVELLNVNSVPASVWQTWTIQTWLKEDTKPVVKKSTIALSSSTSSGQFIWNSTTKLYLHNRPNRLVDIALFDANGDFVAYLAIYGRVQTLPGCLGTTTVVPGSGGDENGVIKRIPDGGTWPAALTKTSIHTIGRSNECSSGPDPVVKYEVNYLRPVQNTTTVTYQITAYNNACSLKVSSLKLAISAMTGSNFTSLTTSMTQGSVSTTGSTMTWSIGDLDAGVQHTLTVNGIPKGLGALTSTASVSAPTSGLVNTGDDSDSTTITTYAWNYVGFDVATATATEGTDTSLSVPVRLNVPATNSTTVAYSVSGTAAGAADSTLASGSIVVPAGDVDFSIDFTLVNDTIAESTETLVLTITGVTSSDTKVAIGTTGTGDILTHTVTITDEDVISVDHYQIVAPSSALSCLASTVTVTACADASNPCTNASTSASGSTATLATSAGTLGATTLTFNSSGVASTTLSHPTAVHGAAVTVTLSGESTVASGARTCCPDGVACAAANSCSVSFSTAGFIVAASAGGATATLPTQTAGTASGGYVLRAVKTGATTQACEAALTGSTTVNWAAQCNDPSTCSTGNLMTLTGNGATAIASNPASGVTATTAVAMTFDANGNAPFSFVYADVGQVTLHASKAAGGSLLTALAGSSNAFVVKPGGFAVSNIKQTAAPQLANPAAASAAGSKFIKAGEAFTATVTAQTSTSATAPNYGREASAEGVLLTRALVLPAGGAAGTLSNATIAGASFSAGVATVTNLAFSEVGVVTLTPSVADGSYLGAGSVTGAASGNVGRFVPAQFALSAGSVAHRTALSCGAAPSFSYLGENFRLGLTLTAQNAAGATTANYTGSFAKLDPTAAGGWNVAGRDAATVFTVASGRLSLGSATGSFSNGVAAGVAITANATRATTAEGPYSAAFGVAPVDGDGVAMAAYDMASASGGGNDRTTVGSAALRYGRLRLASAAGAADRALVLPATAQYWNGSAFATNTLDDCTTVATSAMNFGNLRGTLTTADTAASAALAFSAGSGSLRLAAPSGGRSGTYDVALSLGSSATDASCLQAWTPGSGDVATAGANLAHLRGAWCGSTQANDPAARATFGRQRGLDSLVYRRENF